MTVHVVLRGNLSRSSHGSASLSGSSITRGLFGTFLVVGGLVALVAREDEFTAVMVSEGLESGALSSSISF